MLCPTFLTSYHIIIISPYCYIVLWGNLALSWRVRLDSGRLETGIRSQAHTQNCFSSSCSCLRMPTIFLNSILCTAKTSYSDSIITVYSLDATFIASSNNFEYWLPFMWFKMGNVHTYRYGQPLKVRPSWHFYSCLWQDILFKFAEIGNWHSHLFVKPIVLATISLFF